jgi:alpha-tubulin suppressor-like RCC1 family protein
MSESEESEEVRFVALIAGCVEFPYNNRSTTPVPDYDTMMLHAPHVIPVPPFYANTSESASDEPVPPEDDYINLIATSSAASHCFIALKKSGFVYAFGRNEKGQLGAGDRNTRNIDYAARLSIFGNSDDCSGGTVTKIACGKQHSLFLNSDGAVYACGDNTWGQCGTGKASDEPIETPVKVALPKGKKAVAVDAGIDFSLILDQDGVVYSFGCPEHGKLGNGTDGAYNSSASSVKMKFEEFPTPTAIKFPTKKKILQCAAGNHHCLAVDESGKVFVWGDGTHGRLGLGLKTADVFSPTLLEHGYWNRSPPIPKFVVAGGTSSIIVAENGASWIWGKVKQNEEAKNTPQILQDLQGWDVHSISCGSKSVGVAADNSVIIWGQASGELGFGPHKKSSASPALNQQFEGLRLESICLGAQHTMFLVQTPSEQKMLTKLNAFKQVPESQSEGIFAPKGTNDDEEDTTSKSSGKRKGSTTKGGGRAAKKSKK